MDPEWFSQRVKEKFINQCHHPDVPTVGWDNSEWQRYWMAQRSALSMYNMIPMTDPTEEWRIIVHRGRTIGKEYKYCGKTLSGHSPVLICSNIESRVLYIDLYEDGCHRIEVLCTQREIYYYGN